MIELVKSVAESNGLKVTETPTLIQIAGPAPEPARQQPAPAAAARAAAGCSRIRRSRCGCSRTGSRHASAVQLAPVLSNLFSGFSGALRWTRQHTTIIPNAQRRLHDVHRRPPNQHRRRSRRATSRSAAAVTEAARPWRRRRRGRGGGGGGSKLPTPDQAEQRGGNRSRRVRSRRHGSLSIQAGDIRIIAEESSNSLLVRATESDFALVQQIIGGVDLRPLQVLIEVTIAEVQRTHDLDVGVSGSREAHPEGQDGGRRRPRRADRTASARDFILAAHRRPRDDQVRRRDRGAASSAATCACCRCR